MAPNSELGWITLAGPSARSWGSHISLELLSRVIQPIRGDDRGPGPGFGPHFELTKSHVLSMRVKIGDILVIHAN